MQQKPKPKPATWPAPQHAPSQETSPTPPAASEKGKQAVTWGWIFTGATLLIFFFLPVAIGFGVAAIARSGGKRTGSGVAIIAASLVACVISIALWAAAGA